MGKRTLDDFYAPSDDAVSLRADRQPHTLSIPPAGSRLTPAPISPLLSNAEPVVPGSGRTQKRGRDNRPSESDIHEKTISKLFSAQRNSPNDPFTTPGTRTGSARTEPAQDQAAIVQQQMARPGQRTNLHAFWKIDSRQQQTAREPAAPARPANQEATIRCECCDGTIRLTQAVLSAYVSFEQLREDYSCSSCARLACSLCAVENESRRCLDCV